MRGDTDLKDKEDEDNNISVDENVTEEGGDEHDLTDVEENCRLFLSRGAANTRRSSALLRSVVLVVTSPSSLLLSVSSQPVPDGGVSSNLS